MIPTPESRTELQDFLDIVTYTGSFVLNLLQNTAILRELLKKAVELVKSSICKKKRRWHTSIETKICVQVDASGKGLGAVLLQDKKLIAYASKSLTDAESY